MEYRILIAGESGIYVEFGQTISEEVNGYVNRLEKLLLQYPIKGVIETIPTFRSLFITYDCSKISYKRLVKKIGALLKRKSQIETREKVIIEIPVCYEEPFSVDMEQVMNHTGLTREEVIAFHSGRDYLIYMLGFLPGFPYLGGMDQRLNTPRLTEPRVKIEAGSVGIGGEQTGIYPLASPGGWRLIGKTPVVLYDPEREKPILYKAGEYIRFVRISKEEYDRIERLVKEKKYICQGIGGALSGN